MKTVLTFVILISIGTLLGGCGEPNMKSPLEGYDLTTVTNVELAPIYRNPSYGQETLNRSIKVNDNTAIASLVSALQDPSPWQKSEEHWFSRRNLKMILENDRGEKLGLWIDFCASPSVNITRFERLPNPSDKQTPDRHYTDLASKQLADMLLQIMATNNIIWVYQSN